MLPIVWMINGPCRKVNNFFSAHCFLLSLMLEGEKNPHNRMYIDAEEAKRKHRIYFCKRKASRKLHELRTACREGTNNIREK